MTALAPGSTIGILGGGQLGRMLSVAAARLGYKCCIYEPAGDPPAAHVANYHMKAGYDDLAALAQFAQACDVVTYEFENIPETALDTIGQAVAVRPGREALRVSQDRLTEKDFLVGLGLSTAPYRAVASACDLADALAETGSPAILKTRRFGYDGKGQIRVETGDAPEDIWAGMSGAACILEGFVAFSCEISVIAARGLDGRVACFDPGENRHEAGILRQTQVPARVPAAIRADAVLLAGQILNALDYVGVLGVELFVTPGGLVVNEIAPRVHNSGHWTQNACNICQFEQHIRAITGLPLGDGARHSDAVMENLIGTDIDRLPELLADPGAALHLYGKGEMRPGRKMGHVNRVSPRS